LLYPHPVACIQVSSGLRLRPVFGCLPESRKWLWVYPKDLLTSPSLFLLAEPYPEALLRSARRFFFRSLASLTIELRLQKILLNEASLTTACSLGKGQSLDQCRSPSR